MEQTFNLIKKDEREPSKGLKTLRIYSTKFGLKVTTTTGMTVEGPDFKFIYKQSSADIPEEYDRPDWIEDLKGNIVVNPFQIYNITLPYNLKIKSGMTEYLVENHGELNNADLERIKQDFDINY